MRDRLIRLLLAVGVCLCVTGVGWSGQTIIYVDAAAVGAADGSSWSDAFVYLQDALAAASAVEPPVEIRVAQGVYTPVDRNTPFELLDGIAIRGGYAGTTAVDPEVRDPGYYTSVLSGDLNGDDEAGCWDRPDNSVRIVTGSESDATAVIDGFTIVGASRTGISIENGSATIRDCTFEKNNWYGLESIQSSGLVLANCRFTENGWGGIHGWDCRAVLTNCVFERNGARHGPPDAAIHCPSRHGLGLDTRSSHLALADCIFRENEEGGLDVAGTLDLTRCSFTGNDGAAVCCWGTLTAGHCTFVANEGGRAGAIRCLEDFMLGNVEFDCTLLDCEFIGNQGRGGGGGGAVRAEGNSLTVTRCVFAGNTGSDHGAGAIATGAKVVRLSHCTFTGNTCRGRIRGRGLADVGAVSSQALVTQITNCTFAGNRGKPNAFEHRGVSNSRVALTQCIVWGGEEPFAGEVSVTYSSVQGGYAGDGNMELDPCFVAPGHWDTGGTANDKEDDVWVTGDYHLRSQAGHWDQETASWICDDVTSPCIDAGDPNGPLGFEPFPNGGYANLGAYGGTTEASRSYFGESVCETHIAGDINGDCRVDDLDMDILLSHWLMEDIGRANIPPTVTIVSPQDGAELSPPQPLVFRFEASDPDGRVLAMNYRLEHDHGYGTYWSAGSTRATKEGWELEHEWSRVLYDGVYVLRAEALDDDGDKAVAEITITLHP